jgi:predicted anti-sigma-YlaC factor YlaD
MNCERYRNDILLADAGELAGQAQYALAEHLRDCTACNAFSESLSISMQSARQVLSTEATAPSSMVSIRHAAERQDQHRLLWFPTPIARVAAIAALFVIMVGATWVTVSPKQRRAGLQVQELSAMVAMVSDAVSDNETTSAMIEDSENLQAVALQILEMEGFAVDDCFESDEAATLLGQPDPTTTQWRRTLGLPAQKCG